MSFAPQMLQSNKTSTKMLIAREHQSWYDN